MAKDVKNRKKTKNDLKQQNEEHFIPLTTIEYQVDTLDTSSLGNNAQSSDLAYYHLSNNVIVIQHYDSAEEKFVKFNKNAEYITTKIHENKHKALYHSDYYKMPMDLEQNYKRHAHDEISATLSEVLYFRQIYIDAKNDNERKSLLNNYTKNEAFSFYIDAIKSGKVNPLTTSSEDFENEMKFIAQETEKKWMKEYMVNYDFAFTDEAIYYFDTHDYNEMRTNSENYKNALSMAYTIGGIDFSKYINDIKANPTVEKANTMLQEGKKRNDIRKNIKPYNSFVMPDIKLCPNLSPKEQFRYVYHQILLTNLNSFAEKKGEKVSAEKALASLQKAVEQNYFYKQSWNNMLNAAANKIYNFYSEAVFVSDDHKLCDNLIDMLYKSPDNKVQIDITPQKAEEKLYQSKYADDLEKYVNKIGFTSRIKNRAKGFVNKTKRVVSPAYHYIKDIFYHDDSIQEEKKRREPAQKYEGKPIYYERTDGRRISDVIYENVYDFSQPILANQLQLLRDNEEKLKEQQKDSLIMIQNDGEKNKLKMEFGLLKKAQKTETKEISNIEKKTSMDVIQEMTPWREK